MTRDHLEAAKPVKWKGYTLDELNFRRALNAVQIEIERERIASTASSILPKFGRRDGSDHARSITSKMLGALDYADYAIIGYKLYKAIKRLRGR